MTRHDGELGAAGWLDVHGLTAAARAVVRLCQGLPLGVEEHQAVAGAARRLLDALPDTAGSPDVWLMGRALAGAVPRGDELAELLDRAFDGRALFTGRRGVQTALQLGIPAPPHAWL
ncbi:hypothetical protein [Streptomyces tricolor]|uniref:hypothetical protein n=1 Tax=Streptomyces tricolor TaxID=68277 RepID=UPI0036EBDE0C